MKALIKLYELKEKMVNKFITETVCNAGLIEYPKEYKLVNHIGKEFFDIIFYRERLTEASVIIILKDMSYYGDIKIPSESIARRLILDAKIAETCQDYALILKELLTYDSTFEFTSEVLYIKKYSILERNIYNDGDVILSYRRLKDDTEMKYYIRAIDKYKKLIVRYRKIPGKSKYKVIKLKTAQKVFESIVDYMLKISSLSGFNRLRVAIKHLIWFTDVEKRDIREAIKELIEKYGYRDVFRYYINRS